MWFQQWENFAERFVLEIAGRNTGYPTVLNALRDNGSSYPTFTMDIGRTYLTVTLPVHPYFLPKVADNDKKSAVPNKDFGGTGRQSHVEKRTCSSHGLQGHIRQTISGSGNNASKRHIEASAVRVDGEDLQEVATITPFDSFDGVRRTLSKVSIFLVEGFDKIAYHDKKITPCRVALRTG